MARSGSDTEEEPSTDIVTTDDVLGGEPRLEGRRIGVLDVHDAVEGRGLAPATVADRYGTSVAAVYPALAYYHEHPSEMHRVRRAREHAVEANRDRAPTPTTPDRCGSSWT
jgi:uncharacterized protein (DUF433 family)